MWNKSKNVLQNETKDLTFAFSNLSITFFFLKLFRMRGQKFISFTQKGGEVLKFVAFLRILLFLNNWSIVHFCEWWVGAERSQNISHFCGRHNCVIWSVNKATFFSFGVSVKVKQPASLLSICTFKMKSNLKNCLSSRMAPKRAIANLYYANVIMGEKLKTCHKRPHLSSGHFIKTALWDNHLPKTTTFEWSQKWLSHTGLTVITTRWYKLQICYKFLCGIFSKGTQSFNFIKHNTIWKLACKVKCISQSNGGLLMFFRNFEN